MARFAVKTPDGKLLHERNTRAAAVAIAVTCLDEAARSPLSTLDGKPWPPHLVVVRTAPGGPGCGPVSRVGKPARIYKVHPTPRPSTPTPQEHTMPTTPLHKPLTRDQARREFAGAVNLIAAKLSRRFSIPSKALWVYDQDGPMGAYIMVEEASVLAGRLFAQLLVNEGAAESRAWAWRTPLQGCIQSARCTIAAVVYDRAVHGDVLGEAEVFGSSTAATPAG